MLENHSFIKFSAFNRYKTAKCGLNQNTIQMQHVTLTTSWETFIHYLSGAAFYIYISE